MATPTTPNLGLNKVDRSSPTTTYVNLKTLIDDNMDTLDAAVATKAPKISPTFTGTPTAPTAAPGTNTTQLATAAFVQAAIAALVNSSPAALDTLRELAIALGDDPNFATTMTNALALKAPINNPIFTGSGATLPADPTAAMHATTKQYVDGKVASIDMSTLAPKASPAFTGNPTAPTPSVDDNDTSIATTAFVIGQASTSTPAMDSVASVGTSKRYARADHVHPTDTSLAPVASPTFTGTVTLPGDPTSALHAATKQYVDTVGTTVSSKVSKNGDTMTGNLITSNSSGTIAASTTVAGSLEVRGNGGSGDAAFMSFHRPGAFGAQFGLDTDNKWKVGGWSTGAAAYELWHDNRLRVNSSGKYLEWNDGGTWYPVGGTAIGASNTVQHSQATEITTSGNTNYTLAYKFVPKGTGDLKITADLYTSDTTASYPAYIYVQVGQATDTIDLSNIEVGGMNGKVLVDWTSPIGAVITVPVGSISALNVPGMIKSTPAAYGTVSGILHVHSKEPVYLFLWSQATGKVKNINIQYDILG
ncbi:hypothetical protein [Paenibacillus ferrarius]|uniref:hypothetical protein n=1 Tax=Paenibacillus ferrarius TaxID=1469647 RepID=UPI003D2883F6